ncbi:MAG: hypothetical protein HKP06_11290 [Flavobacteriaceae bacterium]|nr:hypothetical protein [Flavobacteriaceae bacterium]
MKNKLILTLSLIMFTASLIAQESNAVNSKSNQFLGTWKIDLRPTPDAEGYYQEFAVTKISDNVLEGTFYGSTISNGLVNFNWNRIYFAFSTSDTSSDYYHSGYVEEGKVHGISYCPNRNFTAPWTGVKK